MANYYIDNVDGLDSNNGLTDISAFKSLIKLQSDVLNVFPGLEPSDLVNLKDESQWFEQDLQFTTDSDGTVLNPIILTNYGASANKPIINGSRTISNWVNVSGNIWESQSNDYVDSLYLLYEGVIRPKGKLPAEGTLIYTSSTQTVMTASNIPDINYTGGEVVLFIEKNDWIHDKSYISAKTATTITYTQVSNYDGSGTNIRRYYIENAIEALQSQGDWMYSASTQKYTIYSTVDPNTLSIQVPIRSYNLELTNSDFLNVNNLSLRGSNLSAIFNNSGDNFTLDSVHINNQSNIGVDISNATNNKILNSLIENCLSLGIQVKNNSHYLEVIDNEIRNISMLLGYSGSSDGKGFGLFFDNTGTGGATIRYNYIHDIGYIAIRFDGNDCLVEKNIVERFCKIKDDGAGIYTYGGTPGSLVFTNRTVTKNIVKDGGSKLRSAVYGIYIDDNSFNVEITFNLVINIKRGGFYNHNSSLINFVNNIVMNSSYAFFYAQDNLGGVIENNDFSYNHVVVTSKNHSIGRIISDENNLATFSTFNHNKYISCSKPDPVISTRYVEGGITKYENFTFSQWQATGRDINSTLTYLNIPEYIINSEGINLFPGDGTFESTLSNINIYHANGTATITRDTTSKITGTGSLLAQVTSASTTTTRAEITFKDLGSISNDKKYILRFKSLAPSGKQSLVIYARVVGAPYNTISDWIYDVAKDTVTQHEYLLQDLVETNDGGILIDFQSDQGVLYIDDFEFREVDVTLTDYSEYIKPVSNTSKVATNISIGSGTWKDLDNNIYTDTINLESYETKLLITTEETIPTVVGSATYETQFCENETRDFLKFTDAQIGDLMLVMFSFSNYGGTDDMITPENWSLVFTQGRIRVYGKIKTQNDIIEQVFYRSGDLNSARSPVSVIVRNADFNSLIFSAFASSDYAGDMTISAITNPSNYLAIALAGSRDLSSTTHDYSVGWNRIQKYADGVSISSLATKSLLGGGTSGTAVVGNNVDMQGLIIGIPYALNNTIIDNTNPKLETIFKDDFERDTCVWSKDGEYDSTIYVGTGSSVFSTNRALSGTTSLLMTSDNVLGQSNNFRYNTFNYTDDALFEFSINLPQRIDLVNNFDSYFNLFQFKGINESVNLRNDPLWVIGLSVRGGKETGGPNYLSLGYTGQFWGGSSTVFTPIVNKDISLNTWTTFRVRYKLGDGNGRISIWQKEVNDYILLYDIFNAITHPTGVEFIRESINNYGEDRIAKDSSGNTLAQTFTEVYLDDFNINKTNPNFIGLKNLLVMKGKFILG